MRGKPKLDAENWTKRVGPGVGDWVGIIGGGLVLLYCLGVAIYGLTR